MILAVRYTVKGVRKGYKKYQANKLEKEQAAKGTIPDLEDPSRELDVACQAERSVTTSSKDSESRRSSSESTREAEKALENDPEFQKYMERQRTLYLSRSRGSPPTYESTVGHEMPAATHTPIQHVSSPVNSVSAVSDSAHCVCHNCIATRQNWTPVSAASPCLNNVQELPAPMAPIVELEVPDIQITNSSQIFKNQSSHSEDDLVLCEMPGDLPAILPEKRSITPVELPTPSESYAH